MKFPLCDWLSRAVMRNPTSPDQRDANEPAVIQELSRNSSEPHEATILHVAESFGGGVAEAIRSYVQNAPEYTHLIYYATRDDAPVSDSALKGFARSLRMPESHFKRIQILRALLREFHRPVVIHAHSSFAGAYVRLSGWASRQVRIIYTPHCFAFERRDIGLLTRSLFWAAEAVLSLNTSAYAACGVREARLAMSLPAGRPVLWVPNVVPSAPSSPSASSANTAVRTGTQAPAVIGIGRIGAQKDPQFFASAIVAARKRDPLLEATWIGSAPQYHSTEEIAHEISRLRSAQIAVVDWLPREEVRAHLTTARAYLHTARWEGFPIAVLEAIEAGVPVVVRDLPVFDGLSTLLRITRPSDFAPIWESLKDPSYQKRVATEQRAILSMHDSNSQSRALHRLYRLDDK